MVDVNKVVLRYSGVGSSVILKWLQELHCEVLLQLPLGLGRRGRPARARAQAFGASRKFTSLNA